MACYRSLIQSIGTQCTRVGLHAIHRALEACYQSMMHSRHEINCKMICLFDAHCKTLDMLSEICIKLQSMHLAKHDACCTLCPFQINAIASDFVMHQ